MPKSKRRTGIARQKTHDQLLRAELRRQRAEGRGWRGRVAVPLAVLGGLWFLIGTITSRMGVVLLPFDRHHLVAQFGGAAVAMVGLSWLGREER
ncbi:MAG: hypothetical protein ACRD0U_18200 [Acidimicrobiales bacterium]